MCFKHNSHVPLFQMHMVILKLTGVDISKYLKHFVVVY